MCIRNQSKHSGNRLLEITGESYWLEMKSIKGLEKAPTGSLGLVDFLAGQVTLK